MGVIYAFADDQRGKGSWRRTRKPGEGKAAIEDGGRWRTMHSLPRSLSASPPGPAHGESERKTDPASFSPFSRNVAARRDVKHARGEDEGEGAGACSLAIDVR